MRLGTTERLRLKPGVDPKQGAARLAELVELGGNVTSRAGGSEGVPTIRARQHRPRATDRDDADEEILATCILHRPGLAQFSGQDVTLITADTGMRLRGQAHGLTTLAPEDNYRAGLTLPRTSSRRNAPNRTKWAGGPPLT